MSLKSYPSNIIPATHAVIKQAIVPPINARILMALIENDTKEFMMPIHEDWIVEVDEVNKRMRVNLPGGLLEL
jgi:hypothetical protein